MTPTPTTNTLSSPDTSFCSSLSCNIRTINIHKDLNEIMEDDFADESITTRCAKHVSFAPVKEVYHVDSYPQYLYEQLYYSVEDYRDMKQRNCRDVQEAHFHLVDVLFRPGDYRGLERMLDENRKPNRFRCIQAVLIEQDRQFLSQEYDSISMADMYAAYCVSSIQKAQRLATMDEQDAKIAISQPWETSCCDNNTSIRCCISDESNSATFDSLRVYEKKRVQEGRKNEQPDQRRSFWRFILPYNVETAIATVHVSQTVARTTVSTLANF